MKSIDEEKIDYPDELTTISQPQEESQSQVQYLKDIKIKIKSFDNLYHKLLNVKLKQLIKFINMSNNLKIPSYLLQSKSELVTKFEFIKKSESSRVHEGINSPGSRWSLGNAAKAFKLLRNRYNDVLPWDYNRVKLSTSSSEYNDYINASRIKVQIEDFPLRNYIACQGPLQRTTSHFWSMCFYEAEANKQDEILIVMVTPLVENNTSKCYKYWPSNVDIIADGSNDGLMSYIISVVGTNDEYVDEGIHQTHCKIEEIGTGKVKSVHHVYFDKWKDFNKPDSVQPIIVLTNIMKDYKHLIPIIHCSAGVGRTGTLITLEYYLNYLYDSEKANVSGEYNYEIDEVYDLVFAVILQLRECRMMMVQSSAQFFFIYHVLKQFF